MRAAGRPFEYVVYPEAEHAFFKNTADRYNPNTSADAWRRTLAWFLRHLIG